MDTSTIAAVSVLDQYQKLLPIYHGEHYVPGDGRSGPEHILGRHIYVVPDVEFDKTGTCAKEGRWGVESTSKAERQLA